jgi:acetyl esterase/lipase
MTRLLPLLSLAACLLAPGCTRFQMLDATVPRWGYHRTSDVAYGDHPRQRLDVYVPAGATADKPASVVVFFYGGYWQYGSKADYRFVGQALAEKGFVAVLSDYRLYPDVLFPSWVDDGAAAVRWTRDHVARFGGDPNGLFLMGHSAGAHTAALLTLDERYLKKVGLDLSAVRATASLSGPYDFVPGPDVRRVFGMAMSDDKPDARTQPVTFARAGAPPLLLLHGEKDDVCGPENATALAARIRAVGGRAETILYPSLGHAGVAQALAWSFRWRGPVLRDAVEFFRREGMRDDARREGTNVAP